MDQTKFLQGQLCESAYGRMAITRLIIQRRDIDNWYYHEISSEIKGRKQFEYNMNVIRKQHASNQRESLSQSCSPIAMKSDYQITSYKQHESIKPYLPQYNMGPFNNMV